MSRTLIKLGDPITGLSGVIGIPVQSYNIPPNYHKIIDARLESTGYDNELKKEKNNHILEMAGELYLFEKSLPDFLNSSMSLNELMSKVSKKNFSKLLNKYVRRLVDDKVISSSDANLITNQSPKKFNEMYDKFLGELRLSVDKLKLQIQENIKKEKRIRKINRVSLDDEKGYKINIEDDIENSKKITIRFFEVEKKIEQIKPILKLLNEGVKSTNDILLKLNSAYLSLAVTSTLSGIVAFFIPVVGAVLGAGSAFSLIVLTGVIIYFKTRKQNFLDKNAALKKIISLDDGSNVEESKISYFYDAYDFASNGWKITDNIFKLVMYFKSKISNAIKDMLEFSLPSLESLGIDGLSIILALGDRTQIQRENDIINNYTSDLKKTLDSLYNELNNIKKVEWVVIKETPKNDSYNHGGKGGRNLVFKNLETGQILTINEMLQQTDLQLYKWGLKKVYNPARKVTYIRKLPNKTKLDNLG
ncbi:hypothetical protein ACXYRQ_01440 [Mycoplasma sp. 394]